MKGDGEVHLPGWQGAVFSIQMLMRHLGLHARFLLRRPPPNPTTVRSLVSYGVRAPSALHRCVLFFFSFLVPIVTPHHRNHEPPPSMKVPDVIRINDLTLLAKFKDGTQWSMPSLQPVKLSLSIAHDIRTSGELDDLGHTLNYVSIVNALTELSDGSTFSSLETLIDCVFKQCFETYPQILSLAVKVTKPKALLRGKSVSLHVSRSRSSPSDSQESFSLEDIEFPILIGVNPEERVTRQTIRMNLTLIGRTSPVPVDYRSLADEIYQVSMLLLP